GRASAKTSAIFTSNFASKDLKEKLEINKKVLAVKNTRNIGKKDMKLNDFIGEIKVNPETYDVTVNGEIITSDYVTTVPMAKKYFMF
ncbi:MAG: urease subunit alpha, partial [Aliarcobacter sp.]|nr:urease subunit alpha [Aliarcobacter sp.]